MTLLTAHPHNTSHFNITDITSHQVTQQDFTNHFTITENTNTFDNISVFKLSQKMNTLSFASKIYCCHEGTYFG